MGARPLRRVIQEEIEDKVADYYIDHSSEAKLLADVIDDQIVISAPDKQAPIKDDSKTSD
ncbi:ATP-dependent Clp protease ATP-binding subunit ClpA [Lentilactobacillus kosonis]|uniref:ATP-dependent Clp protease ATP-binding subunit ClpA n=1 Tax=Lentilactobacillus kosonis TaxID=2810561 RepID=A0A401FPV1_9LACO|nr:ATP-dependent Clp protease ATP-binding subunit ClpA [Lentilactobacillus kosonis]